MISGDLLFQGSVGRTDFHNSSLDDLYARWVLNWIELNWIELHWIELN